MNKSVVPNPGAQPPEEVVKKIDDFLKAFAPYELESGGTLHLFLDEKSGAYYLTLHLTGPVLSQFSDAEAALDADEEDEIYKLNRDILENQPAYQIMERDALNGRSFEDIVLEYDTSYRQKKPLKIYGGQHRLRAITKAEKKNGTLHGVRVYFGLSREQKVEIATINNTAIAVPSDLLDRMREQLLGSELRVWGQIVGLLETDKDFADRRSPDLPTVRLARTLLVNFYKGKDAGTIEGFHEPILCKSGDDIDENYLNVRAKIDWKDEKLKEMGQQFARLHRVQRTIVSGRSEHDNAEFARKTLSLSVVASWAYAAGLFQKNSDYLNNLYSIPDNVTSPNDPLNAKALSEARLKGTDPDTYRGLGTRSSPNELGRMLEVFLVLATKGKKQITKNLANAAIQSYEAKRATHEADKVLRRI